MDSLTESLLNIQQICKDLYPEVQVKPKNPNLVKLNAALANIYKDVYPGIQDKPKNPNRIAAGKRNAALANIRKDFITQARLEGDW